MGNDAVVGRGRPPPYMGTRCVCHRSLIFNVNTHTIHTYTSTLPFYSPLFLAMAQKPSIAVFTSGGMHHCGLHLKKKNVKSKRDLKTCVRFDCSWCRWRPWHECRGAGCCKNSYALWSRCLCHLWSMHSDVTVVVLSHVWMLLINEFFWTRVIVGLSRNGRWRRHNQKARMGRCWSYYPQSMFTIIKVAGIMWYSKSWKRTEIYNARSREYRVVLLLDLHVALNSANVPAVWELLRT